MLTAAFVPKLSNDVGNKGLETIFVKYLEIIPGGLDVG